MGFGQGLSGLNAASSTLDVIGNNIANSGTVGFKTGTATFADVYANSRVGLGVQVAGINQRFTVGTIAGTGNQFDMAIDGAKGLFRVIDSSDNVLYTRNGQFFADKNNNIVNAQGQRLTGYIGGSTTPQPITVPVGNIAPVATSSITNKLNLDANAKLAGNAAVEVIGEITLSDGAVPPVITKHQYTGTWANPAWVGTPPVDGTAYTTGDPAVSVTFTGGNPPAAITAIPSGAGNIAYAAAVPAAPFDVTNPDSFTHMLPITVYDSLGNPHQLSQYFAKREPDAAGPNAGQSKWEVFYQMDGVPVTTPATGSEFMYFDDNGVLKSPVGQVAVGVTGVGGAGSPAAPLSININYNDSTQFGGDFSKSFTQDGSATGEYASMSIASDGSIVANYTNGETKSVGTMVLADFNNLQGLQPKGGNAWAETSASGQPVLGTPGSNGLATIKGQAVEESNVDMSQELVNMIIAQRTYQANAQTIKTQDQVLQTLINMR
ncbi:MAG TPA: flagellar hook-basal body complex protein [Candidimonas sp.]|nr:flagellar hook-basal body complex protein [Candidimonas sp.]